MIPFVRGPAPPSTPSSLCLTRSSARSASALTSSAGGSASPAAAGAGASAPCRSERAAAQRSWRPGRTALALRPRCQRPRPPVAGLCIALLRRCGRQPFALLRGVDRRPGRRRAQACVTLPALCFWEPRRLRTTEHLVHSVTCDDPAQPGGNRTHELASGRARAPALPRPRARADSTATPSSGRAGAGGAGGARTPGLPAPGGWRARASAGVSATCTGGRG